MARRRFRIHLIVLEQKARKISELEYDDIKISNEQISTSTDHKKRMRNKSAFISRQTHRRYEKLLEELLCQTERERDGALHTCLQVSHDIEKLRHCVLELTTQLAATSETKSWKNYSLDRNHGLPAISDEENSSLTSSLSIASEDYDSASCLALERPVLSFPSTELSNVEQMSHIIDEAIK
eukprot:IDg17938t1